MKKHPFVFFLLLTAALFPLPASSADPTMEIPPPPDIETTIPPPDLISTDTPPTATPAPPPVPASEAPKAANTPVLSVPPPPVPADEKPAVVPAASTSASPAKASDKNSSKISKKSKKSPAVKGKKEEDKKDVEVAIVQPTATPQPTATAVPAPPGPSLTQLVTAYKYAYELYAAQQFDKAKDLFKKIAMVTEEPTLKANSLYYYSQCAFRTEDYIGCVKGLRVLVKKVPECSAVKKGFVSRFCVFLIDQASNLQTNWDYFRYQVRDDENGNPVWKESIPPGPKIKRINFRLGFGLYSVLHAIQPDSPEDLAAKQKLQKMLDVPLTVLWVDEKAAKTRFGHPADFLSTFSTNEKKDFSKVICQRMFFNFETEYFYKFLDMHDDVRNLKPRFVAVNKVIKETASLTSVPPPSSNEAGGPITTAISTEEDPNKILTLYNLLHVAGYYPWLDSYSNTIEAAPTDLNL